MPTVREIVHDTLVNHYVIFAKEGEEIADKNINTLADDITMDLHDHGIR